MLLLRLQRRMLGRELRLEGTRAESALNSPQEVTSDTEQSQSSENGKSISTL